jgi:hypothetical protein
MISTPSGIGRHQLLMRLPVALSFRDAFQRPAYPNSFAVKFSQQQFGDLHCGFFPYLIRGWL